MLTPLFRMTRIPVPDWASAHARGLARWEMVSGKYADAITPAARDALTARHADLLDLVDELVEEYVNDDELCPPRDCFPERATLTGAFYVGRVSYHRLRGETWIQICVSVHCLGNSALGLDDYLGLDVWLRYDPASGRLWSHRNTDSKVI